ncbi:MAG: hypothetical protein V4717_02855 [Bacteroidota bacterium]
MRSASLIGRVLSFLITIGFTKQQLTPSPLKNCFTCDSVPEGTIFCDDFESETKLTDRYFEYDSNGGDFIRVKQAGRNGSAGMRVVWQPGEVSAGSLKKSFGRTPDEYIGKHAAYPKEDFNEIYWRIDLKRQPGWQGGGGEKLTRAMVFTGPAWCQGMIAHLWSADNFLVMDPASGIDRNGILKSTRYNDFNNLRWLGNKRGTTDLFSDANTGKCYCIVAHVKLNTPGKSDGIFEFWIDNQLQAGTYNLNWHGNWNSDSKNYKINAVFFENYWSGSPILQERYFDNLLISSEHINCDCD